MVPTLMRSLVLQIYRRVLEREPNNKEAMIGYIVKSQNLVENLAMIKGWLAKGITFPRLVREERAGEGTLITFLLLT